MGMAFCTPWRHSRSSWTCLVLAFFNPWLSPKVPALKLGRLIQSSCPSVSGVTNHFFRVNPLEETWHLWEVHILKKC